MFSHTQKEDKFYELFCESTRKIHESAKVLLELVNNPLNGEDKIKEIKDFERTCDVVVHTTMQELNKTFLTPFDREDIYTLAKEIDNIEDYIESSASKFSIFNVKESNKHAIELCEMIVNSTFELISIMEEFKKMSKSKTLVNKIININKIEEDGDLVSRQAVSELFDGNTPVLDVIKWREIYHILENTLDACENVANIVEGVVMKNA